MLHLDFNHDKPHNSRSKTEHKEESGQSFRTTLASQSYIQEILLSTAVVDVEDVYGNTHDCRVLLDSASQSNFITENMVHKLGLQQCHTSSQISGIGKSQSNVSHTVVCTINSKHTSYKTSLNCLVMPNITHDLPHIEINTSEWRLPSTLKLADIQFNSPGPIDMLIGAELFFNLLSIGQMRPHKYAPIFQKTSLGWVASGKVNVSHARNVRSHCHLTINGKTSFDLQKFWEIEECGSVDSHTKEELDCEQLYASTTTRDSTGRYTVQLPTKENINLLCDSYDTALCTIRNIQSF